MQIQNRLASKFSVEHKKQLKVLMMLYRTCNNNCDFCFEKQFDLPTIDEFRDDIYNYVQLLSKYLQDNTVKYDKITVNLMGGELFFTGKAIEEIKILLRMISNYDVEVRLATNLLYDDMSCLYEAIEEMDRLNIKFSVFTSFDFGPIRFDSAKLIQFKQNLVELIEYANERFVVGVEVTRTKYMLEELKYNATPQKLMFEYIVKHCSICLDELIGDFDYALTREESIELWKLLLSKYKDITDLKSHFVDTGRNCINVKRIVIANNKIYDGCISQKYKFQNKECDKLNYALDYVKHYNCINCKHYNRCPLKCPIERRYDKCDITEVFDFIDNNNVI